MRDLKEEYVHLPEDVFRLMRDLICEFCGLFFDDDSRYLLEKRLSRRLKIRGLITFRDYYRYLLYDRNKDEELAEIIDILTVNETYFFREEKQFKAFSDEICEELKAARSESRRIKVWSAGCASGEEAYTIAMMMLEKSASFAGWDIEILGSDINQRVLQTARRGVYRKNSFRGIDDYFLNKYFVKEGESYRVKDDVKRLVNFSCLNLLDPNKVRFVGQMDVIFCRNVLIYFHPQAKKKAIDTFYQRLNDGGYLMLGHAESLMNISTAFALKHLKNDMVYQRPKKPVVSMSNDSLLKMVWGGGNK